MHISGTTHIHGPHGINPPHGPFRGQPARETPPSQGADRVEISSAAEAAIQAAESGEMRTELVNQLRAQIAAGTYETPEKLDVALDRLLDEIG
jgi:negative regulator of flagellin synthesis FlgM